MGAEDEVVYWDDLEEVNEMYFDWLWERSGLGTNYFQLLTLLYTTPYEPLLVDDENRRADGNELFEIFCEEKKIQIHPSDSYMFEECSVLEMLLAFAARINVELVGDPSESRVGLWFSRMLENLGIYQYDDEHWDRKKAAIKVWCWMHKKGNPSPIFLFPIDPKKVKEVNFRTLSEWERVNLALSVEFL